MTQPLGSRLVLAISLVLAAANLRPVFSSLGAILPDLMRDTGASPLAAGILTTAPVICLGLFAPMTGALAQRFGMERVMLAVLALITAGTLLRGVPSYGVILLGSVLTGSAIAVGNVLLPGLVKRDFADRTAAMTAFYTMAICGGGALGAGLTVPLAARLPGGWPSGLAAWAVPAALVTLLWLPQVLSRARRGPSAPGSGIDVWRDRLAWRVTLLMGFQSGLAYCVFGWLAPILRERGLEPATAGYLVSFSFVFQLVGSLATPWLATRGRDQRAAVLGLLGCTLSGYLGSLFGPLATIPLAVAILGVGQGGLLAVTMLIILLRSPDAPTAARLSGMAQGVGYVLAATGPLVLGLIRSTTGGFAWTGLWALGLGLGAAWAGLQAGRRGQVGAGSPAGSGGLPPAREVAVRPEGAPSP